MWKHALIARIHQQTCARCEKKRYLVLSAESGCGQCTECFGRARPWKTKQARQDKTRQDGRNTTYNIYRRDPRLGCGECFGCARLYKTWQDKTDKNTTHNRRDPSLGCSECFGSARLWTRSPPRMQQWLLRKCKTNYGRQDKTRQDGRNTAHNIFRNRREHHLGCRNALEAQDSGRQDKTRLD